MSESLATDDTDALLVIPPDLFLEESDSEDEARLARPARQVKDLVQKLDSLQSRLVRLENVSHSESFERSPRRRHTGEALPSPANLFTLSERGRKPAGRPPDPPERKRVRRKLRLPRADVDSLFSSSSCDDSFCSSVMDSPDGRSDGLILGEIDAFLEKSRRVDYRLNSIDPGETARPSVHASFTNVDDILSKYIYLADDQIGTSRTRSQEARIDKETCKKVDGKNSSRDSNANFGDFSCNNKSNQLPGNISNSSDFEPLRDSAGHVLSPACLKLSKSNFEPVDPEQFIRKTNLCNVEHKKNYLPDSIKIKNFPDSSGVSRDPEILPKNQNTLYDSSILTEKSLPSLHKLWNTNLERSENCCPDKVSIDKIEEEKVRRQHCEEIIQTLQKKILELHQKLAVAVQIDSAKDETILKHKNSLLSKSKELNDIEQTFSEKIINLKTQLKNVLCSNDKFKNKIKDKEEEIMKFETAIHEYEGKLRMAIDNIESQKNDLSKKVNDQSHNITEKENAILELKSTCEMLNRLNKQLSDNLITVQNDLDKMKKIESESQDRFKQLDNSCEDLKGEVSLLKNEKNNLSHKLLEESNKNSQLDKESIKLRCDLDDMNLKYKQLRQRFDDLKITAEAQKVELKTFYQKQLESIVAEKVNEFQRQLDLTRNLMTNEIQAKEKEIAFQFAKHLNKVENGHQLEVKILEEKHKEEIKFYSAVMSESKKTIDNLQDKLIAYKNMRCEIASQLQTVMESQLQQALKIVLNSTADLSNIDQLKNNIPLDESITTVLSHKPTSNDKVKDKKESTSSDFSISEKRIFENSNNSQCNLDKLSDEKLQHYVKLLLQKIPGLPDISNVNEVPSQSKTENGNKNKTRSQKDASEIEYPTTDKCIDNSDKKLYCIKPPWK